jgi:hypothetical protein
LHQVSRTVKHAYGSKDDYYLKMVCGAFGAGNKVHGKE